jgi:branched-subunit amino acid transport protein
MGKKLTITAFVLSLLFFVPLVPIMGLILGVIAIRKAKDDPEISKGLAIAAIVLGAIFGLIQLTILSGFVLGFIRALNR